ncbi:MAG: exonuclease domain-containing protein [Acidimicrobiales bacterium]
MGWDEGVLVGLDFETTGVDPLSDRPVQLAIVWSEPGRLLSAEVSIVDPGRDIPEGAIAVHGITAERARREGCSLAQAAHLVHSAMFRAVEEAVPVVAMNASFDLTIAEELFRANGLAPLAWRRVLDPLVLDRHLDRYRKGKRRLDALCEHYAVSLARAHDAGADAAAAIELTRVIARHFPGCAATSPERLTELQSRWHASWALGYDAWRRRQGLEGLDPDELGWPLRPGMGRRQETRSKKTRSAGPASVTPLRRQAPKATASVAIPLAHADSCPAGRNAEPFLW